MGESTTKSASEQYDTVSELRVRLRDTSQSARPIYWDQLIHSRALSSSLVGSLQPQSPNGIPSENCSAFHQFLVVTGPHQTEKEGKQASLGEQHHHNGWLGIEFCPGPMAKRQMRIHLGSDNISLAGMMLLIS